jgi:HAE1 family hydrophobic/amphiphilic exporter-1
MPVYRETGANVIKLVEALKIRIDEINDPQQGLMTLIANRVQAEHGLAEPPKLHLRIVWDQTGYIYDALQLVRNNLFIGGFFAGLTLLLFLRRFVPTFVVVTAIPISIIGTFVALTGAGRNINVISLAGLAFAVGMVVDNAIVVLENIDRHLMMGKSAWSAAYDGTREVWGAIVASTLTTLAVFVPILTIEEEAGQLFRDIALAICAAVTLSLIVSVTVIPTVSERVLHPVREPRLALTRAGRSLLGLVPLARSLTSGFAKLIYWATAPTLLGVTARIVVVAGFTAVAVAGAFMLMPPTDYLPRGSQNLVFGMMITPPAYHISRHEVIAERVEAIVRPYWEAPDAAALEVLGLPAVIHPFTRQPIEHIPAIENYFFVSFYGGVFCGATSRDKENVAPMADLLTASMNGVPGCFGFAGQVSLFGRGMSGTRGIDVEVVGNDLEHVLSSAAAMRDKLQEAFPGFPVQPNPTNFDLPGPELSVDIDQVKAKDLGIDASSLGLGLAALVDGITIGDFRTGGETIDIVAVRAPSFELTAQTLAEIPLAYADRHGRRGTIPISEVATIEQTNAPQQIIRVEELRAVTLTVTPPDSVAIEQATETIDAITAELRAAGAMTPDVQVRQTGSASKLAQVRQALLGSWHGWNLASVKSVGFSRFFLAIIVVYLLMAALFESFVYPLVILFSVPLAALGGFAGLRIVHIFEPTQLLDVLTMLGFVILIGVVVNNAILIVHQALNFMRGDGETQDENHQTLPPREAIRESVRSRIRPIFMTTCTSVCGMLPLVLMPGSGSELYRGLGSVVIGGLVVATIFTLIVVPLLFSLTIDAQAFLARLTGRGAGR